MPPIIHRRKLTQKELRAPDEFTTLIDNARDFFINNLTQVIVSAVVVVAVGAIVIGVYYYERHRDTLASARFYDAITALNAGQNRTAETGFKQLGDEEPGRRLGRVSQRASVRATALGRIGIAGAARRSRGNRAALSRRIRRPAARRHSLVAETDGDFFARSEYITKSIDPGVGQSDVFDRWLTGVL